MVSTQDYINSPVLCYNVVQRDFYWLGIPQNIIHISYTDGIWEGDGEGQVL